MNEINDSRLKKKETWEWNKWLKIIKIQKKNQNKVLMKRLKLIKKIIKSQEGQK